MSRVLAHIEKIEWIRPIPEADKICTYGILGWEVVDQVGKYKVGDLVCYVEIDSVLPDRPEFEFMRKYKFRVKTIKLKKQVSQGLILPLSTLSDVVGPLARYAYSEVGKDVTELLGITKYLSPSEREEFAQQERKIANEKNKLKKFLMRYSWFRKLFLSRSKKSGFPYWVGKTDEPRIQNLYWNEFYENYKDKEVYVTEKIDYQSGTWTGKMIPKFSGLLGRLIPVKKYKFVVCSRNLTTNDKGTLYWKIAEKYNIEKILRENPNLTIQGEQGDTKVQGNKYGIKEPTMWVFNIIDHEKNYHYSYREMSEFCITHKLQYVPLLSISYMQNVGSYFPKLRELGSTVQEIIEFSKGKSVINPKIEREGVVVRCIENGNKVFSFKAINPDFLLKYSE